MAYHLDGTPKRTVGYWYPDIESVWTKEMESHDIDGAIKRHRTATKHVYAKTDKQFTSTL
jgi:hypothetical protein